MRLQVVTPETSVFDADVVQVTVPTAVGEVTILPHHVPFAGIVKAGEMLVKSAQGEMPMALSGGFFQFTEDGVVRVLADTAERAEDIIESRAEEARQRAEAVMADRQLDTQEFAVMAAKMEKELARLKVVRKYRHAGRSGLASDIGAVQE